MPSYKLTYFDIKALAEPLRFLLSYGKTDFEDVRVAKSDWPALKKAMPLGQMPVLEIDGKVVHQSLAIARYLGKQFGIAGKTDWENLEIDMVVDTVNDLRTKIAAAHYEQDEDLQKTKYATLESDVLPFYLDKLDAIAKANGGHLALGRLTWADVYFAGVIEYMNLMARKDLTANHSNLKTVVDNVLQLPAIQEWIAKRPDTE